MNAELVNSFSPSVQTSGIQMETLLHLIQSPPIEAGVLTRLTMVGIKKTDKPTGLSQAIYQSVLRWHFYAGITFAPFLIF
jgi:hypothetical protein